MAVAVLYETKNIFSYIKKNYACIISHDCKFEKRLEYD